jgi:hypothetical protein
MGGKLVLGGGLVAGSVELSRGDVLDAYTFGAAACVGAIAISFGRLGREQEINTQAELDKRAGLQG